MFKSARIQSRRRNSTALRGGHRLLRWERPFIEENDTSCFVYPFDCLDCDRLWRAGTGIVLFNSAHRVGSHLSHGAGRWSCLANIALRARRSRTWFACGRLFGRRHRLQVRYRRLSKPHGSGDNPGRNPGRHG